ncbi:MAG TPA: hypothetical protein DCZ59_01200 [Bacteroidetes bacterium]|nr:hypothetical protein [Bacteroidota bacterium]
MIVAKFGGTSVADAAALRQVNTVVSTMADEPGGVIVVLSATAGTTSKLLDIARRAGSGKPFEGELSDLLQRHQNIAAELTGSADCVSDLLLACQEFAQAVAELGEWNDATLDAFCAFGELLSTTIYHAFRRSSGLASSFVDARRLIATDDRYQNANVDHAGTHARCSAELSGICTTGNVIVTQGFIASSHDGMTTTLGRGGSDYSAAIIGACVLARQIRIYTDVSGVFTCDPRLVPDALPLRSISFDEMRDMASYGAKVLHPDTLLPAVSASIPVYVLNTFRPDDRGTCISDQLVPHSEPRGVSVLDEVLKLTARREIGTLISQNELVTSSIVLTISSKDTMTLCVHTSTAQARAAIDAIAHAHEVRTDLCSLVSVTGQHMSDANTVEDVSRSFAAGTDTAQICVVSDTCVIGIVERADAHACVRSLHGMIIRRQGRDE